MDDSGKRATLLDKLSNVNTERPVTAWAEDAEAIAVFLDRHPREFLLEFSRDESESATPVLEQKVYHYELRHTPLADRLQYMHQTPLIHKTEKRKVSLTLASLTEIGPEERQALQECFASVAGLNAALFEMYRRSHINDITGLPKEDSLRKYAQHWAEQNDSRVQEYLAQRSNGSHSRISRATSGALFIADLNLLGKANKAFGMSTGDDLLRKAAGLLVQYVQPIKANMPAGVWHLHGDEFALLCEGMEEAEAAMHNEEIPRYTEGTKIEAERLKDGLRVSIPVSIAIGFSPYSPGSSYEAAKRTAERMLNPNKIANGRKYMHLFQDERQAD